MTDRRENGIQRAGPCLQLKTQSMDAFLYITRSIHFAFPGCIG